MSPCGIVFPVCAWTLGPGVDPLPRAFFWLRRSEDDPRQQASTSSPARGPNRQNLSSHQVGIALRLSWPGPGEWEGMQLAAFTLSMLWVNGVRWKGSGHVTGDTGRSWAQQALSPFLCGQRQIFTGTPSDLPPSIVPLPPYFFVLPQLSQSPPSARAQHLKTCRPNPAYG